MYNFLLDTKCSIQQKKVRSIFDMTILYLNEFMSTKAITEAAQFNWHINV